MPQACADKLTREIATYGNPPKFPTEEEAAEEAPQVAALLRHQCSLLRAASLPGWTLPPLPQHAGPA